MGSFFSMFQKTRYEDAAKKNYILLLRYLNILFFFFFAFSAFLITFLNTYFYSYAMVFFTGLAFFSFVSTFEAKTINTPMYLTVVVFVFATSIMTVVTSPHLSFQFTLALASLIIYCNSDMTRRLQLALSLFLLLWILALNYLANMLHLNLNMSLLFSTLFFVLNTITFIMTVFICTYFHRNMFIETEVQLRNTTQELIVLATTDPLTKLANRRHLLRQLDDMISNQTRSKKIIAVAIGDIDFFKKINDTYGHNAGDMILVHIANILMDFMAQNRGIVARWGGEEFLLAFEMNNFDVILASLEQLRAKIEQETFSFEDIDIKITMSFGLEEYSEETGVEGTVSIADEKLYYAKQHGRNQVSTKRSST